MKAPTEAATLRACLDYLTLRRVYHWRANQGAIPCKGGYRRFTGLLGVSDVLGCLPGGRLLAVEVKSPTGRLRPAQAVFLDTVRTLGGLAIVARSVADLESALREAGL